MSRKSSRLQSRNRRDTTEDEIIATFAGKRKAEEELERDNEIVKRRQQFQIQNQWIPISHHSSVNSASIVLSTTPSPPQQSVTPKDQILGTNCRFQNYFVTPIPLRQSPLPTFQWANSAEVWQIMLRKEESYVRDPKMLMKHPQLQPRMRAILIDWLVEVCEVYRLHRESLYLAIDFIDRYLCKTEDVQKSQLQLIGITSLFIAAKLEEIYPPKLNKFAYVTDGACTEEEILHLELIMLKALNWDLTPVTSNAWLNIYLQLTNVENKENKEDNFVFPQYSAHAFIQIAQLLDLCFLDIECLQFPYSILATCALYHLSSEHVALSVSGYQWMDIAACVQWMAPFATTLRESGPVELKFFDEIPSESTHNIQTHTVDLSQLEKVHLRQKQVSSCMRSSPDVTPPGIMTPPQSKRKSYPITANPATPEPPMTL